MRARDLLDRLRPAGAPGSAGRVGVPAERTDDAAVLAVLAALQSTQAQAQQIRERARRQAATIREDGVSRADAVLARARVSAAEQRAAATARAREAGEHQGHLAVEEATRAAQHLAEDGLLRLPELVADVTAAVRRAAAGSSP